METDRTEKQVTMAQPSRQGSERQEFLNLPDLLGFYISRLPLLIAAIVIGAVVAALITFFLIPDKYTATSRMYMVSASSDSVVNLADLNIGTSLSSDYVELMQTRPIVEGVIRALKLDYRYEDVLGMLSLSVVQNTRIVKISATSTDPQEAMAIANQMARTSRSELPKVMEAPTPTIAELAVLPTRRSSPSLIKNVAIGAASLFLIVLSVLTVFYKSDDTIKTSQDLEKAFGIIPLSVIPEGKIEGLRNEQNDEPDRTARGRLLRRMRSTHKRGTRA